MNPLALLVLSLGIQIGPAFDSSKVARDVTTRFYAWYAPVAAHTAGTDMKALHDPRWHFSPALISALRADSTATANTPGEIVGLDMDPFLNSQDPCTRYAPTGVRRAGQTFLVDVRGSGGCSPHTSPDVTVRIAFQGTTPVFINFIYSKKPHDDLLSLLAQLAASRAKKPHR